VYTYSSSDFHIKCECAGMMVLLRWNKGSFFFLHVLRMLGMYLGCNRDNIIWNIHYKKSQRNKKKWKGVRREEEARGDRLIFVLALILLCTIEIVSCLCMFHGPVLLSVTHLLAVRFRLAHVAKRSVPYGISTQCIRHRRARIDSTW